MNRWCLWLLALALAILTGCAAAPTPAHLRFASGPFPGDAETYSFGVVQDPEYFAANIERAQRYYGLFPAQRIWSNTGPVRAPATMGALRVYYPLSVRWQLKDGRQFILEDIDIAAIMREYFKTHSILLQHQREGRERARGDGDPCLIHEIRDDSITIKWLLQINHLPLEKRGKEMPRIVDEVIPVITLKGNPTSGIDFEKRWETRTQK